MWPFGLGTEHEELYIDLPIPLISSLPLPYLLIGCLE